MQVVLNLDTDEYFIVDSEEERVVYLKKLLYNKPYMENKKEVKYSDSLLNWKCIIKRENGYYIYYKTDIIWFKQDRIKIVPLELTMEVLNNIKYQHIVRINDGINKEEISVAARVQHIMQLIQFQKEKSL